MTVQNIIGKGARLTLQEIGERARLSLRTSGQVSGVLLEKPEVVGKIVDDLIPKTILDSGDLIIRFHTNTILDPQDNDEYELWQRKGPSDAPEMVADGNLGQAAGRPATVDIEVPTVALVDDDLAQASTLWEFELVVYRGDNGNPDSSDWFPVQIDRNAPEQDKASGQKFKPETATLINLPAPGIIDDEWLSTHDSLDIDVNISYQFYRPDDTIIVYLSTNYGVGMPVFEQTLSNSSVAIPTDDIPQLDGQYFLWYELRDIVGNVSDPSLARGLRVSRRPAPVLLDCVFPKGILPDVIDLADLETPVFLEVPYSTNGQQTDRITPTVSNGTLDVPLGSKALGIGPANLQFTLSNSRLLALWNNATAEVPITGTYVFTRGVQPPQDSRSTSSALDFTYRGPINPIFPGRENPNMVRVTVVGKSGTPNHITEDDRLDVVTISTPMVAAPNPWVPLGDETAKLWFDGKEVHSELLTAGTVTVLTAPIPAAVIEAAVPGKKIAYWTIEETGGRNVMKSFDTEVQLDAVRLILPKPTVRLFNGFVSCRYLTRPDFQLPVTVPIHPTAMPVGTVVTLRSIGTTDSQGLMPIPGTDFADTYTITGAEAEGVFIQNIQPYLTKLKPIQPPASSSLPNGYIKIWYEITVAGAPLPSMEFLNEVSLLNASNNYCEGTPTD
ncbi:hypothetical protein [Pseudomonas sp. B35(2017)]|uniref:hypothetical protein n=1 Tax=Pseudomonas sp. B35(2017) TaxID=1981722 RepID=UPI00111C68B9|nr:hypothetical protein [Pseudomonas sp. B35(2017)]